MPASSHRSRPHPDDDVPDELLIELEEDHAPADDLDALPPPRRGHVLLPTVAAFLLTCLGVACLMPDLVGQARTFVENVRPDQVTTRPALARPSTSNHQAQVPPSTEAIAAATASTAASTAVPGRTALPSAAMPTPSTPASAPAPGDPAASPQATPEDLLAGPVDDDVLQQLMEDSLPNRIAAQDPAAATGPQAAEVIEAAWTALSDDLLNGGWNAPHRQASVLTSTASLPGDGKLPATVSVAFMWIATTAAGELTDREISQVDLNHGSGAWAVDRIRTMGQS